MSHTSFAKRYIELGNNVQFGIYCNIATDLIVGNNVLFAGKVSVVGRQDHDFKIPGRYIWDGVRIKDNTTIIEDDVWIGTGSIIIAGVKIHKGSIVAAGSVVTKDIPECEIWGGNPARKLSDRFNSIEEKESHILFLKNSQ